MAVDHTRPFQFGSDRPKFLRGSSAVEEIFLQSGVVERSMNTRDGVSVLEEIDVLIGFGNVRRGPPMVGMQVCGRCV